MSEYPKMLYRASDDGTAHKLGDVPIAIHGKYTCDTLVVLDAQEEVDALAEGWTIAPDPEAMNAAQIAAQRDAEKDALLLSQADELALLRAQLEEATAPKKSKDL